MDFDELSRARLRGIAPWGRTCSSRLIASVSRVSSRTRTSRSKWSCRYQCATKMSCWIAVIESICFSAPISSSRSS